jgi:hypothetical protein
MAIPVFVTYTTNNIGGTDLVLTLPGSLAVGDLLIAHCSCTESTNGSFSDATGDWTLIHSDVQGGTSNGVTQYVYFRVVDGTEDATYTFVSGRAGQNTGFIIHITGANPLDPIGEAVIDSTGGSPAQVSLASQTLPANSLCLIIGSASDDTGTFANYSMQNDNPTWTERYQREDTNNSGMMAMATGPRAAAGATGTITATFTTDNHILGFVSINEAPPASSTRSPSGGVAVGSPMMY